MPVDKSLILEDSAEIDRILRQVESLYWKSVREGSFDREKYDRMQRGEGQKY